MQLWLEVKLELNFEFELEFQLSADQGFARDCNSCELHCTLKLF